MKRAISLSFAVFLIFAFTKIKAQEVAQTNIQPINNSVSLLSQLQPISFNYDKNWADKLKISSKSQFGFLTSDFQKVLPALVTKTAKDYAAGKNAFNTATIAKIDYESLVPLLVGSIKEQQLQIEELRREVQMLKSQSAR
ncbi:tail fiber domain-containing protein [Pedobacter mucosus]|uniref:tail fiber domain-containing protein n=1 Tax=Pedobacter mucosus TaxID=2895286 RepID=UPI001EE3D274|nr:tail fiber domain-containing protein [Pedobacter mucosus]UKT63983.1 tail fiber domain-containing protein [Pedobacter mucosus]